MSTKISTNNAPAAIGPYSQAVIAGGLVYTSGQIPINPASGAIEATDITAQTEQVIGRYAQFLRAAVNDLCAGHRTVFPVGRRGGAYVQHIAGKEGNAGGICAAKRA